MRNIDNIGTDFSGFQDIFYALNLNTNTSINLRLLGENIKDKILGSLGKSEIIASNTEIKISLKGILDYIGVVRYEIINDYKERNITKLKKNGVIFIISRNDHGDINIENIDGHFNPGNGKISRAYVNGKNDLPYVLMYMDVKSKFGIITLFFRKKVNLKLEKL